MHQNRETPKNTDPDLAESDLGHRQLQIGRDLLISTGVSTAVIAIMRSIQRTERLLLLADLPHPRSDDSYDVFSKSGGILRDRSSPVVNRLGAQRSVVDTEIDQPKLNREP